MLFSRIEFFYFALVVALWVVLTRTNASRKAGLLVASYYFYAYWDWRFAGLLLACSWVNFFAAARIAAPGAGERARRGWLAAACVLSLGTLVAFKYANFFIDAVAPALQAFGLHPGTLAILLPAGISFFTFQALSYTIDVYRRHLEPVRAFSDFALFVVFFPQLIAGPIVRAADFLPQLMRLPELSWGRLYAGFRLFTFGLFKKVFVADRIAPYVEQVFADPGLYDGPTLWLAAIAYAIQIYCDFSGYSDMAIGLAGAMGYDFPRNFNLPYLARSLPDFWRRWHISLSSWLRDYLYIPLGGNRGGTLRVCRNLLLTMVLGGLWHGAAWTFVFWGFWHGAALCLSRLGSPRSRERGSGVSGWVTTQLVVLIGWVVFRSPTLDHAALFVQGMAGAGAGEIRHLQPFVLLVCAGIAAHHAFLLVRREREIAWPAGNLASAVLLSLMWLLVIVFYPVGFEPFIYFQF